MHDIKWIRSNPDQFDVAMARRGLPACGEELLTLDEAKRDNIGDVQALQARSNALAKEIGALMGAGKREEAAPLLEESRQVKTQLAAAKEDGEGGQENDMLTKRLASLPNILSADVPDGVDENANVELRRVGEPGTFDFAPKLHDELGEALGLMDFERAAKISGARFVFLRGALAQMERALAAFMLDIHTREYGYEEVSPPLLVRDEALFGTSQLPKFAEDSFRTTDGRWLIPTAEVSLTNIVHDAMLAGGQLPLRYVAFTPCFRSEAGSAGRDTRGMIRQHQFSKVELVSITTPEQSEAEHERLCNAAEEVLKRLGLPYRAMLLCAGDTGFGARKTYDLEVWLPGQGVYREISSCSNCGDFQARRMKARFRMDGKKETHFVHTLNGSGLAVGRTLVAVLENYQQADGSIKVPKALQPYMGDVQVIEKTG